jgi:hypothetical protein
VQTTDLQEVVAALTAILGSDKCRSPAKLPDSSLGGFLREVDVVVDAADIDPTREGLISIEVRDRGTEPWAPRPKGKEDVGFVDEMHGKHLYLPTAELVLVSKSGFSANALKKAEFLGIKMIMPAQITSGFVGEIVNNLDSAVSKVFRAEPEKVKVMIDPPIAAPDGRQIDTIEDVPLNTNVHSGDRTVLGVLAALAKAVIEAADKNQASYREATGTETSFKVTYDKPNNAGEPVYLLNLDADTLHRITYIEATGSATVHVEKMALQHRDYDGTPYSAAKATPGDDTHHWVFTEGTDGLQGGIRVLPEGKAKGAKFFKAIIPPRDSDAE